MSNAQEYFGLGIAVVVISVAIYLAGKGAGIEEGAPTQVVNKTPDISFPINEYHFQTPGFNPIPISQVNIQQGLPMVPQQTSPGPNACDCACSSVNGDFVSGLKDLQDTLNKQLTTKFAGYLDNIMDAIPDAVKTFVNNAEGAGLFTASQEQLVEFSQTANVQKYAGQRQISKGAYGIGGGANTGTGTGFSYSAGGVFAAQFVNNF